MRYYNHNSIRTSKINGYEIPKEPRMQVKKIENKEDYIEDLVERENTFTMEEFAKSINEFLEFRKYDVLKDNGKISRKQAEEKAEREYTEFNKNQKITSDFDRLLLEANRLNDKK